MQYSYLGRTGLQVSRLCLGTMAFGWSADTATSLSIMDAALKAGITFFDTANMYSSWIEGNNGGESETIIGQWLQHQPRRKVVIATKVRGRMWPGPNGEGLSRGHIMQAIEDSLRRLNTDYIDLYQVHFPDENTPLEETLAALDALVRHGKVRYIGASNHPAWVLTKALWVSDVNNLVRYESIQPHHNLLHRDEVERELADLCRDQHIGIIPYSPLAGGFLSGKYTRGSEIPQSPRSGSRKIATLMRNERAHTVLDRVREIANAHGVSVPEVAIAWQLAQDFVTASIIGPRTTDQLTSLLGAMDVHLSTTEIDALNEVSAGF